MNLKVSIVQFFIFSSLFYSCQSDLKKEENARKEIMDLHDEVMPKMEEIYDLKTILTKIQDSLGSDKRVQDIRKRKEQLIEADESMMKWMRNFKDPDKSEDHESKMNYYQNEKNKMESVKSQMVQSIDSASEEIKKIRNSK